MPSTYVTLCVEGVPMEWIHKRNPATPFILSSLLEHEQKMSVLHFTVQRTNNYAEPMKSKDPFVFHVGFRRQVCRPIFSINNLNGDKHKFERFLSHGSFGVASIFAPITFTPAPVLIFKSGNGMKAVSLFQFLKATFILWVMRERISFLISQL